jgi:hypothetical protein
MYGTWHVKSNSTDATLLRNSPVAPRACDICRSKKVCRDDVSKCFPHHMFLFTDAPLNRLNAAVSFRDVHGAKH